MPDARLTVIPGPNSIVLVAPHGGRRDPVRRPWGRGRLRVNDLHTPALTAELATRLGAAALVNAAHDRNDVDLNRITETHTRAPEFLAQLAELLSMALAHHPRITLLTVHGWNVIQPALDLGLGCVPRDDPFAVDDHAAVSPGFAAGTVRRLVEVCAAKGLTATVGARYPARHRENLLQLFTPRYRDDPRPLVRALADLAPRIDAVQLELGIPLRWPGPWRDAFLAACVDALPALVTPPAGNDLAAAARATASPQPPVRLQFTSPTLCGLVAHDGPGGGRLLLFPPEGGLLLFTGERVRGDLPEAIGPLHVSSGPYGGCRVRFRGPVLRFADTFPFLDLEPGLATAHLAEADVALEFAARDHLDTASRFGALHGTVRVGATTITVDGSAFCEHDPPPTPWPRLRAQLRLDDQACVTLTLGLHDGLATGSVRQRERTVPIATAHAEFAPGDHPLAHLALELGLADGTSLGVRVRAVHRLPVVRGHGPHPIRLDFVAARLDDGPPWPAGWCELGGV